MAGRPARPPLGPGLPVPAARRSTPAAAGTAGLDRSLGRLIADATAGHSVGELAAGVIAGVITADEAIRLVGVRGRAMAQAAAMEQTGMTAVLGGDEDAVLAAIASHGLTPANVNAAGQIVAAGTLAGLAALAADPQQHAAAAAPGRGRLPHLAHGAGRDSAQGSSQGHQPRGPVHHPALGRRRRGGHHRQGVAGAHCRPGRRAGALGPVHADDDRTPRDRADGVHRPVP